MNLKPGRNCKKDMDDKIKYGFISLGIWNFFLVLMAILAASIRNVEYSHFFDDGTGGIGISILIVIWSLIWFGIGYHVRKKYVEEKSYYMNKVTAIDETQYNKEFVVFHICKYAKMLTIVFLTAIPWYILGYVDGSFSVRDFTFMGIMALLTIISFGTYKLLKK